jgi:hypothetical protein
VVFSLHYPQYDLVLVIITRVVRARNGLAHMVPSGANCGDLLGNIIRGASLSVVFFAWYAPWWVDNSNLSNTRASEPGVK